GHDEPDWGKGASGWLEVEAVARDSWRRRWAPTQVDVTESEEGTTCNEVGRGRHRQRFDMRALCRRVVDKGRYRGCYPGDCQQRYHGCHRQGGAMFPEENRNGGEEGQTGPPCRARHLGETDVGNAEPTPSDDLVGGQFVG